MKHLLRSMAIRISALSVIVLSGCSEPRPATKVAETQADSAPIPPLAVQAQKDSVISTRTVIFMHGTTQDFDALRRKYSEDDAATIFDDAMWYRSTAYEYLERLKLPVQQVEGKRSFTFRVNGSPRTYDFSTEELIDVIVLYEPEREPRAIATVEMEAAAEYFGITPNEQASPDSSSEASP